ncbi:hypothetical protein [Ralstonia pickettii]|mgnify:CR=1 FL=1|uniref:Transmembrane protein n=1 Tax=Ralstonia pickettii TaxID=329 RepID=A0AAW4Q5Y9_RALPI|nr:hypothetical protein [Ralstonia pickettii]MBA9846745.1 hypothetical protein [Ralstonia pickettii]MBA9852103.1 hypothetical protein [Ralstonia pickettii]MBA9919882.1 hypothetical protein [Ralstonia pickettii]MBA9958984.1 hypothetical protein [Ralstonia pickettii]MBA9964637.1 hypothetical protein [Ralstonia pickettii]
MVTTFAIASAFFAALTIFLALALGGWNKAGWTICGVSLVLAIGNAVDFAAAPVWVRWLVNFVVFFAVSYVFWGGPGTSRADSPRKTRPNWPWA